MTAVRAAVPIHYLQPAKTTRTPGVLYVLDTETRALTDGDLEVHVLRLWASAVINRREHGGRTHDWRWSDGVTAAGLAQSVDRAARRHGSMFVYAHNLGFDLATTRLPEHLTRMGWEVGDFALSGDSPWMKLRKHKATITLADSASLWRTRLEEIARMIGDAKLPLPAPDAGRRAWLARCRRDVSVLGRALCQAMDWYDAQGPGTWSLSGPATGWGPMRARLPAKTVLIDPDPAARALDRSACYGGRRQVWRVGEFRGRRYLELDIRAAYPTTAGALPVPIRRGVRFTHAPLDHPVWDDETVGLLAEVTVRTATPRYPLRWAGATFYPTGQFRTVLADPEIRAARRRGDLVAVHAGQAHRVAPVLARWADWLAGVRDDTTGRVPDVVRFAARSWGRTVIGKFGAHSWERTELGPAPDARWRYEPGFVGGTGAPAGTVDLGGRRWWCEQTDTARDAYPAVMAWVESAVRVAISDVIDAVGPGAVVQCNTDGLIVAASALGRPGHGGTLRPPERLRTAERVAWCVNALTLAVAPLSVAVKRSTTHLTVLGPQHTILGGQRKLSGIPADAADDGAGTYTFRSWPSLTSQLTDGDERGYVRPVVVRRLDGNYPAGWVLDDGSVFPPAATLTADGRTRLLPWQSTPDRPAGRRLSGAQNPILDDLL